MFAKLRTEWRLKLGIAILLILWVCIPYYGLQHVQFFPETVMPAGFLDNLVPFDPNAVWLYLSLYLLMPLVPLMMQTRDDLVRYASGMAMASLLATIVFIFWPTVCLRPPVSNPTAAYQLLTAIDRPFHAFPSLHACFAIYSVLWAKFERRWILWIWAVLIGYGALATKQHVLVDLIAGSFLGVLAYAFAFRLPTTLRNIHENKHSTYYRGL